MKAYANTRCGKHPTAAEFVRISNSVAEFWIGHDGAGHYQHGFVIEATPGELEIIEKLARSINDPATERELLPGSMNDLCHGITGDPR